MKHPGHFRASTLVVLIALLALSIDSMMRVTSARTIIEEKSPAANLDGAPQVMRLRVTLRFPGPARSIVGKPSSIAAGRVEPADPCQPIIDAIERLEQRKLDLEDEKNNASGIEITVLQKRIDAVKALIKREQATLKRCQENPGTSGPQPPPPTFSTTLTVPRGGVVAVSDNSNARGPFTNSEEVVIPLIFDNGRTTATVFPLVNIKLGSVTVQQLTGITGPFDKKTGSLDLPSRFRILTSFGGAILDFPFPGLTTETGLSVGPFRPTGSRLDGAGNITLTGAATTTDNILFGSTHVQVTIKGTISPLP